MMCDWISYGVSLVFLFNQKTAYEMHMSDWSTDVCSSDLLGERTGGELNVNMFPAQQLGSAGDSVRMLQTGVADFIFIALPYHSQELPAPQAVNLPWGWDARTASNVFWRAAYETGVISAALQIAGIVPVWADRESTVEGTRG